MLKKTVTYTDFNGQTATEDLYFNLTKAEVIEMVMTANNGDLIADLEAVSASNDPKKIIETMKMLIFKSYGIRSEDGKRFVKSAQISEEFSQTEAYSEFFMQLVTDANFAVAFAKGILPPDLAQTAAETVAKRQQEQNVFDQAQATPAAPPVLPTAPPVLEPEQRPYTPQPPLTYEQQLAINAEQTLGQTPGDYSSQQ